MFVQALRTGYVGARRLSQIMPWATFRNMTDGDLRAIYAYLKTVPPVKHSVDNTEPPSYCPIDKSRHGFGERNARNSQTSNGRTQVSRLRGFRQLFGT